jgi:hypothetical protein
MSDPTVSITQSRYDELLAAEKFLDCLIACGVDNWDFYDDARDMMGDDE